MQGILSRRKEGGKEKRGSGLAEPTGSRWRGRWREAASAAFLSIFLEALHLGFADWVQPLFVAQSAGVGVGLT